MDFCIQLRSTLLKMHDCAVFSKKCKWNTVPCHSLNTNIKDTPLYGGGVKILEFPWGQWIYSVTQLPVEFQWHWQVSNAEISIIRTTNIHIFINLMIKMTNLIGVIHYMTVMTDISAFDTCQCHWNSTGNWVTEYV